MINRPSKTKRPRVFLSYAMQDRMAAELMGSALEAAGYNVWNMANAVHAGENWGTAVVTALETSDAMVALISPSFADSAYSVREVEFALTNPRYRDRLIPVMVRPTSRYPWILSQLSFIDATNNPGGASIRVITALQHALEKRTAKTPA